MATTAFYFGVEENELGILLYDSASGSYRVWGERQRSLLNRYWIIEPESD